MIGLAAYLSISHEYHEAGPVGSTKAMETITVHAHEISTKFSAEGVVVPGSTTNVLAPFDGVITKIYVFPDTQVQLGQTLATLDVSEVEQRLREAETTALRTRQTLSDLRDWNNSPEVLRAKRSLQIARTELSALQQKLASSKRLLDRGIIPRQEYQDLLLQVSNQNNTVESAQQEIDDVLGKGSPSHVYIAQLEFDNAQARYEATRNQLGQADIKSPASGLLLKEIQSNNAPSSEVTLSPGTHIARGQLVFRVADLSNFSVVALVDEIDINRLQVGQLVHLSGISLGLLAVSGKVSSVGLQANSAEGSNRGLKFAVRVQLDQVSDALRNKLRLGMRLNLKVTIYNNLAALIVPVEAIEGDQENPSVNVISPAGKGIKRVAVKLGEQNAEGFEVLEGLKDGDVVSIYKAKE